METGGIRKQRPDDPHQPLGLGVGGEQGEQPVEGGEPPSISATSACGRPPGARTGSAAGRTSGTPWISWRTNIRRVASSVSPRPDGQAG